MDDQPSDRRRPRTHEIIERAVERLSSSAIIARRADATILKATERIARHARLDRRDRPSIPT